MKLSLKSYFPLLHKNEYLYLGELFAILWGIVHSHLCIHVICYPEVIFDCLSQLFSISHIKTVSLLWIQKVELTSEFKYLFPHPYFWDRDTWCFYLFHKDAAGITTTLTQGVGHFPNWTISWYLLKQMACLSQGYQSYILLLK